MEIVWIILIIGGVWGYIVQYQRNQEYIKQSSASDKVVQGYVARVQKSLDIAEQTDQYLHNTAVQEELSTVSNTMKRRDSRGSRSRWKTTIDRSVPVKSKKPHIAPNSLEWFITDWGMKATPSPAEQRIIDELVKYNIRWEREVSFNKLPSPGNGYCRFDFYLPNHNTIIEYDGELWHNNPEAVANDKLKTAFCNTHDIHLIRYNKYDYYKMHIRIPELMMYLNVQLK